LHDHSGHHHGHGSTRAQNRTRLAWTLGLTLAYMLAEAAGGYWADSLALIADAGHMLSDAVALGLSLFASWIAARPATSQHTFGYYRAEILAALANGSLLIAITIGVFIEAARRLGAPQPVEGPLMLGIAAGGLVVNLIGMAILHSGKSESLNMHGAWLHLLTDALGSVAALIAGGLIWFFNWYAADPIASVLIGILIIYSSWHLVMQAISILMESTPGHLDVDAVRNAMLSADGILEVHDLHIWTITSGMESLSAHVVLAAGFETYEALDRLRNLLHEQFGIDHITIQIEPEGPALCRNAF
jgi:cobalt-zinc-cadmium efflux system protein